MYVCVYIIYVFTNTHTRAHKHIYIYMRDEYFVNKLKYLYVIVAII